MSTCASADSPGTTKPTTRANTALSTSIPGLPALDLAPTLASQKEQLEIYRHLLETLAQSEQESALIFPELSKSLVTHIGTLTKLKDDLHNVFSRIRALKTRFQSEYPDAFDYVQSLHVKELDDE
ncbi:hypothetical protein GGH12_004582 [Coemansia sp. RSA 1822]|nr:hypothetical protein LPJ76_002426 [Coemansia sp. RSA 638]KAJ2125208.1 hypothetical protein IW147_001107 [Coemansia sp. RSA 720]KAJ2481843.1 hypothetical protein IWW56_001459 [Coemansia sp. RSA 2131]KAJ2544251.1 hypothetical protein GGF49_001359 [Coemansia sp. RSA 1853]KAJ2560714.1 hypothetical protein GGH12_004582 [Coemansia sp. RSA 1822]KAJ2656994.1 KxDL motif-containing protein 1 [Coemansia sp. RSA 1199]